MNIKTIIQASVVAALALTTSSAMATSIDANHARAAASKFLQAKVTKGRLNTPSNLKLVHTEKSSVNDNAYYVFNVNGGGWVIIAGDDRAKQVLAYGEQGSIDMNSLPDNMKAYLNRFKGQIECMQNFKGEVTPLKTAKRTTPIGPLMKSNWAQGNPFNRQCPQYMSSENYTVDYSSVGCAGLSMAQILNYWEYPTQMPALTAYKNDYYNTQVPGLPERTINYDLIADQYTTWTEAGDLAWVSGITSEQKEEVAWLCRYASQSCLMNFSPDGSGSNVLKQKNGFMTLGFSPEAKLLGLEAWPSRETWNSTDYTDEEWVALIHQQLEAHHPIPYSMEDITDGHAFVVDGVDADGLLHVNWGWYGKCDGWFQYGAFNVAPQGTTFYFNEPLFMIVDLYPYEGYVSPNDPGNGGEEPVVLGDVNHDGEANVTDAIILINAILNDGIGELDLATADCDGNGEINVTDAITLINLVLNDGG